jgi:hypothetical protein
MSYTTVYTIQPNGDVEHLAEARNSHGWSPHIWMALAEDLKIVPFSMMSLEQCKVLWNKFEDPSVSVLDRICLGLTFDTAWVRKEDIGRCIEALRAFWMRHNKMLSWEGKVVDVVGTIPQIIEAMEKAATMDIRGICFQGTSVTDTIWSLPGEKEDDWRPFNFDKDTKTSIDTEPFDLFKELNGASG